MSILKLLPGQRIHFTVASTQEVQGNFGPQIKFTGETPDDTDAVMFLNVDTAARQLGRIGYDTESVIGRTVEFERIEKNGTKFTNINRVANATDDKPKPLTTAGKQPYSSGGPLPYETESETGAAPAANRLGKLDGLLNLYHVIEDDVLAVSAKKFAAAGVGASPESIAAQIATVFIAAKDRGLAV